MCAPLPSVSTPSRMPSRVRALAPFVPRRSPAVPRRADRRLAVSGRPPDLAARSVCPAAGEAGVLGDSSFLPADVSAASDAIEPFQPIQAMESDESL